MAISYLYATFGEDFASIDIPFFERIDGKKISMIKRIMEREINSPLTSSCGRLFDAVSSIYRCARHDHV